MRLSTQTHCLAEKFGDEQAVRILAEAGYDAIDWSFFNMFDDNDVWVREGWKEHAHALRKVGDECGIAFNQAHAPLGTSKGEEPFDTMAMERILQSIEIASILGIDNIIVHPKQHLPYAKNKKYLFDINVEMYKNMMPLCEKLGVRICTENMWQYDTNRQVIIDSVCSQPEEFCAMVDAVGSPWLGACLDIGHAALVGVDPADFIRELGHDRLKALHVHDVDHRRDCHTLPFMEKLDWASITAALGEIDYTGDFTFEADQFLYAFPKALQPEAAKFMVKTGRYLMEQVEANRVKG